MLESGFKRNVMYAVEHWHLLSGGKVLKEIPKDAVERVNHIDVTDVPRNG